MNLNRIECDDDSTEAIITALTSSSLAACESADDFIPSESGFNLEEWIDNDAEQYSFNLNKVSIYFTLCMCLVLIDFLFDSHPRQLLKTFDVHSLCCH